MVSLEETEAEAAAVQKTPNRVTLASINAAIDNIEYVHPKGHPHATVAFVTMDNGYLVIGMSAPADPGNFDVELGEKFALEDAIRKIWPLEGYLLREKLHRGD
jgi:hypothetical protein